MSKRYDAVDIRGDEDQTVAFLAQLAGGRNALEFAVGTGRIALPLRAAGVRVDGIEMSQHIYELGGRPALERWLTIFEHLPPGDRERAGQGPHCGVVIDET